MSGDPSSVREGQTCAIVTLIRPGSGGRRELLRRGLDLFDLFGRIGRTLERHAAGVYRDVHFLTWAVLRSAMRLALTRLARAKSSMAARDSGVSSKHFCFAAEAITSQPRGYPCAPG